MSQSRKENHDTTDTSGQSSPQKKKVAAKKLELFFLGLNSEHQTLRIPAHKALSNEKVQNKIEDRLGYTPGSARLFRYKHQVRELDIDKPLEEQGVKNNSRIYILGRLLGD